MNLKNFLRVLIFLFLSTTVINAADKKEVVIMQNQFKILKEVANYEELEAFVKQNYPDFIIKEKKEIKQNQVFELEPLIDITIKEDHKTLVTKAPNRTIREILAFLNMEPHEEDITFPSLDEMPQNGVITLFRMKEEIVDEIVKKDFAIIYKESKNPKLKSEVTIQQGQPGEKKVTLKKKTVNGVTKASVVIKEEVLKEAVPHIIETPMKSFEVNNSEVLTRGDSRKYIMNATAYEAGPRSTGKRPGDRGYGITASGTRARRGTVAVDPRVIPLGTKLYIKSLTPGIADYGYAIAEDTGGAIKGMKIDLFMNTVSECFQFGRRSVEVYVLPPDTPQELFR